MTTTELRWEPNGRTRLFGVLGHPIEHTLSPAMHNAAFRTLGINAIYLAFDVPPEDVSTVLAALRAVRAGGVNVTVPLKEVVAAQVTRLHESARRAGAVNTVVFTEDGTVGYSTDGEGFLRGLREAFGGEPTGRRVFVLGAGGAGRTVALECARFGAASVYVSDVRADRVDRLVSELRAVAPTCECGGGGVEQAVELACAADLIIQATPVGMRQEDPSPLPPEAFRAGVWAYDLIYHWPETPFMRTARAAGAQAANGLGMLLHQGARAWEIWMGRPAPIEVMRAALKKAVYG